jgi:hypothetical protein
MLRSCDRFVIDNHSVQDVIKWPLRRKKAAVEYLERLHKIYCGELKTETASYRDIASYFIRKPVLDMTRRQMTHHWTRIRLVLHPTSPALVVPLMMNQMSLLDASAPGAGISSRALRSPRKGVILARALLK